MKSMLVGFVLRQKVLEFEAKDREGFDFILI
jgi:hypothetical protein